MRNLATMTSYLLVALAIIVLPGTASASLFGDVVEADISNGDADPNAVLTQFTTPSATVAESVIEFNGATCVGTDIVGSFAITVDVHGESFTVAITNEGPDRASFSDVSMLEVNLSSLNWVGAPEGYVAGVSNDATNPSVWPTTFEPHAITVLCNGSGQGEWAHQETREWTFEIQTRGHGAGARIIGETCEPTSSTLLVKFDVENINLPEICGLTLTPTQQPAAEGCVIQSCAAPNGWTCSLNPEGGTDWIASTLPDCISPGTIESGFEFVAAFEPGGCCYDVQYLDAAGGLLFEETKCFECEPPVQVEATTWGSIKSSYR